MQINSLLFLYFFTVFLVVYFFIHRNIKYRNVLLLLGSYVFYGICNWKFLFLILGTTAFDYYAGLKIQERKDSKRISPKAWLVLSIVCSVGILFIFKYYNFFLESVLWPLKALGVNLNSPGLKIMAPIGISYYTFKTVSYVCDVYNGKIAAERSFINYALYVSFFPEIIAGPIDKAEFLLSQFREEKKFSSEKFCRSVYLIFWGLFKKIYIADNLAYLVNTGFGKPTPQSALILISIYAYTIQLYCDFSGYIDMARGCAGILGFDTSINFNLPYFAKDPSDFWKRWHITLSVWIKDYIYIPLGGNRKGVRRTYINIMITMTLCGLWHGAGWTYVVWGAYHGLLLISYKAIKPYTQKIFTFKSSAANKTVSVFSIIIFFHLTCFGWLIFRAENMTQVLNMCSGILGNMNFKGSGIASLILYSLPLFVYQIFQYTKENLDFIFSIDFRVRGIIYAIIFWLLTIYGEFGGGEFIYGKF